MQFEVYFSLYISSIIRKTLQEQHIHQQLITQILQHNKVLITQVYQVEADTSM